MAITKVGSSYTANDTTTSATHTITGIGTTTVGDALTLVTYSAGANISTISMTGSSSWIKVKSGNTSNDADIWYGTVASVVANQTMTITYTGSITQFVGYTAEFNGGVPGQWIVDTTAGGGFASLTGSSGNFPSLTPQMAGELWIGNAGYFSTSPTGSTSDYVYTAYSGLGSNFLFAYNVNTPSGAQTPNWSGAAGGGGIIDGLIIFAPTLPNRVYTVNQTVKRAAFR